MSPRAAEAVPVAGTLRALDDLANRLSNSSWPLGPSPRGFAIETRLGGNLPPGFPTIDKFDWSTGLATSIKTVDLGSKTYQNSSRLRSLLKRYIDKAAAFEKGKVGNYRIKPRHVKYRALHVATPHNATPAQQAVIDEMKRYASQQGAPMIVEVIR